MTEGTDKIFRASALQRAASPEELDHLVAITKPADWILAVIVTIRVFFVPALTRAENFSP